MDRRFVVLLSVFSLSCAAARADPAGCETGPPIALSGRSCDALQPPRLGCLVPDEVEGALAQPNYNTVQRAVDLFSWQQFIALNWPAATGKRGTPAAGQSLAGAGPRVWETWKEAYEVYLPRGQKPAAWDAPEPLPPACAGRAKVLTRVTKVSDVVDQTLQALPADSTLPVTLKDQKGRLVRYEVRLNKTLFEYVVGRHLYDGESQARAENIDFPDGSQLVKAAWREIGDGETGHFLVTEACVCGDRGVDTPADCRPARMGLAGFHLMTKTAAAPQWIWSTFEQVDNVVSRDAAVAPLNDPRCSPARCPPNRQTPGDVPTQLRRALPVPAEDPICERREQTVDNVARLNDDVQKALHDAGSIMSNYELIGAQWPLRGMARPALLGNTTMESFSQETSSCMGCHAMSRTLRPDRTVSADFSFTLNNAQPRPTGARCVDVEASESCSDDSLGPPPETPPKGEAARDWRKVRLGYEVATRTYEMLGGKRGAVGSRLHCASCHLGAGGNPAAAWWVDMEKVYPRREALQARINNCFARSMNGRNLCNPGKQCDSDPHMSGLIAYMEWQTRRYHARNPGAAPARGFPDESNPESSKPGDAARGRELFTQRCAFCHNRDGQGRYAHDVYFRPALWGPDSYNAKAGMGQTAMLTAFIRANMPYTSGGSLTWDEARDLAAFVDGQCRPGKDVGPGGAKCAP